MCKALYLKDKVLFKVAVSQPIDFSDSYELLHIATNVIPISIPYKQYISTSCVYLNHVVPYITSKNKDPHQTTVMMRYLNL